MPQNILTEKSYQHGLAALAAGDAELAKVISRWGNPPFWVHPNGFPGIILAILGQQVSIESAHAAFNKLENVLGKPNPEAFLQLDDPTLRKVGFSRQKASYVRGVAREIVEGALDLAHLEKVGDEPARERLLNIRGVGPWTADVYLLFALRRADAWPSRDLALAKAIQAIKGFGSTPDWDQVDKIAEAWRPWRAVAARILWHDYLSVRGRS